MISAECVEKKYRTLKARCERLREIDVELSRLFDERRAVAEEGLSQEQRNKLFSMVMSDGKPHW